MTILIFGRRTAIIKKFPDFQYPCTSCQESNLHVIVSRDYIHVFFLPVLPIDDKIVKIRCSNCGEPIRRDILENQFQKFTKTPVYLYAGLWIVLAVMTILFIITITPNTNKKDLVDNPKVGDVYTVRQEENETFNYYFLKISQIDSNKIIAHPNTLLYSRFVNKFDETDFFIQNENIIFTKEDLKLMLQRGEISDVSREYSNYEGFNRLQ